jgi:hypothetical protein
LARFLGRSANFGPFSIFSQTTPILVEFVEEKKEKTVFAITLARENHSGRNFGQFFGSLRPSGAIGAGFRAIGGHLQVFLLQGSFQGHQGHFSVGAVGG